MVRALLYLVLASGAAGISFEQHQALSGNPGGCFDLDVKTCASKPDCVVRRICLGRTEGEACTSTSTTPAAHCTETTPRSAVKAFCDDGTSGSWKVCEAWIREKAAAMQKAGTCRSARATCGYLGLRAQCKSGVIYGNVSCP